MKEITAWRTTDGKIFTDWEEAEKHDDELRKAAALEKLTNLFTGYIAKDAPRAAAYVIDNLKGFAMAISPLITKSEPKRKPGSKTWDDVQREGAE